MKNAALSIKLSALLAFCLLLFTDCATNPVTGKKQLMLISKDQEKAMGLQADPSIIATYGLYEDEKIQQFIDRVGGEMGRVSHRPTIDYQFRILDSPVVNAFALPGGYIYFTRGILAHFNNEAQFAGVLGHEIGHVTARHSASQYSKQTLAQVGLVAGMIVSEDFRQYADVAQQGLGLLFLKFGRDDESQSDQLGVEYSTKIGYDAHHMADFFQTLARLSSDSGQELPTFLSTHPDPADRNQKVAALANEWQKKVGKGEGKVNRDSYLRLIDGIVYGEDPRQGYFENGRFYHPELKFQFPVPRNWQTVNTPQQVQMAPQDGQAILSLSLAQGGSAREAAQAFVQQTGITVTESNAVQVNGLPAFAIVGRQQDQQSGQVLQLLSYFIEYNGLIYQMMGISTAAGFNTYVSDFRNTITNFATLTDASKINVQPQRIRIKTVAKAGTLQQVLTTLGAKQNQLKELAILNGMQLEDKVDAGTLLKLIE